MIPEDLLNYWVDFTGEENTKGFLEKCLKQYENIMEGEEPNLQKIIHIAVIFTQIKHRIEELD